MSKCHQKASKQYKLKSCMSTLVVVVYMKLENVCETQVLGLKASVESVKLLIEKPDNKFLILQFYHQCN